MAPIFETVAITLSVTSGLISSLITFWSLYYTRRSREKKLQEAKEEQFKSAIQSDDLATLGNYLDTVIGKFNIYEYITDVKVSGKVDTFLSILKEFVGTEDEVTQEIRETSTPAIIEKVRPLPYEFDKILTELHSGEMWNGLARLRRHIEITLRNLANTKDVSIERPLSAGYLLNLLLQREVIQQDVFSNLKYAVTISNKAIHGFDVTMAEAEEAVSNASTGLAKLNEALER